MKSRLGTFLVLVGLLVIGLMPSAAHAQATPSGYHLPAGVTWKAVWDAPAFTVSNAPTGYRIYLDGGQVGSDFPVSLRQANGTITFNMPALEPGRHVVQASAFNTGGESRSTAMSFDVDATAPPAPGNFRLTVDVVVSNAPNGDPQLTLKFVQVAPAQ